MDVVVWLRSLGLVEYEAAFRDNDIDETVLPNLTAEDLKELGIGPLGPIQSGDRAEWSMMPSANRQQSLPVSGAGVSGAGSLLPGPSRYSRPSAKFEK
jgi:hypothetical protein